MDIIIRPVHNLPVQLEQLAILARQEGYHFLDALIAEDHGHSHQFSQLGTCLLLAYAGEKLVGCGGLNQQQSDLGVEHRIGRVRHFYVDPNYRQQGVGKLLLQALEQQAQAHYAALCLHTEITSAAKFYQKQNYVFVPSHANYNYFKYLITQTDKRIDARCN